jgi:hypothetical protein
MQQFEHTVAFILYTDRAVHGFIPFNITAQKKNCMYCILAALNYLFSVLKVENVWNVDLGCDIT